MIASVPFTSFTSGTDLRYRVRRSLSGPFVHVIHGPRATSHKATTRSPSQPSSSPNAGRAPRRANEPFAYAESVRPLRRRGQCWTAQDLDLRRSRCRQGSHELGGAARGKAVVRRRDRGRLPLVESASASSAPIGLKRRRKHAIRAMTERQCRDDASSGDRICPVPRATCTDDRSLSFWRSELGPGLSAVCGLLRSAC
jgi:hypothetical protein